MTQGQFLNQSSAGFEFRVFPSHLTKAKGPNKHNYLPLAKGKTDEFMSFPDTMYLGKT